jgi:hypothetical protein
VDDAHDNEVCQAGGVGVTAYLLAVVWLVACGLFARDAMRTDKSEKLRERMDPETWE